MANTGHTTFGGKVFLLGSVPKDNPQMSDKSPQESLSDLLESGVYHFRTFGNIDRLYPK